MDLSWLPNIDMQKLQFVIDNSLQDHRIVALSVIIIHWCVCGGFNWHMCSISATCNLRKPLFVVEALLYFSEISYSWNPKVQWF